MNSPVRDHHRDLQKIARMLGYRLRKQRVGKPDEIQLAFRLVEKKSRKTVKKGSLRAMALALLDLAKEGQDVSAT